MKTIFIVIALSVLAGCPSDPDSTTPPVVNPESVEVQGGTFQMGSTDGDDEGPVHSVTVDSFFITETEITFDQYDAYCDDQGIDKPGDSGWGRGTRPVIFVSWYDAVKYCNWLSLQDGLTEAYSIDGKDVVWEQSANGWRLPTEAEWEYAARGGSLSKGNKYSGSDIVGEVGWYSENSDNQTHPVKSKEGNELGLYDMSGNVWEWCWDRFGLYSSDEEDNPTGPSAGGHRVLRGGSGYNGSSELRSASRLDKTFPETSSLFFGFRLARSKVL